MRRILRSVRRLLPEGGKLPEQAWRARHDGILALLWLHVPAIMLFGLSLDKEPVHLLVEGFPIGAAATIATCLRDRRAISTVVSSVGLMTSSAVLVHLSGGVIEAHFHFFVMVGVVVLYQEWWPFLVAIGYVVLHHGLVGTLAAEEVYNHPAAINGPWKWAAIHGGFILGMSLVGVLSWRLNESLHRTTLAREQQLAEAQQLSHVGSWEWDIASGHLDWSDELYRIFGLTPGEGSPTFEGFMDRVHSEDRPRLSELLREVQERVSPFAVDFRILTATGDVRWLHGRGQAITDELGTLRTMRGTAHDITERKRGEAALASESLVRQLLENVAVAANESATAEAAMEVAIEQVCAFTGWPVGHAFLSNGEGRALTSAGLWHLDDPDRFAAFRRMTEEMSMPPGVGLPGRVSASGAPAWITDVLADPSFPRREAAREVGIHSGFAFPLLVESEVVGVLEFFSTRPQPVDEQLLEVMAQVGKQLGLVVARTRATEELRASDERHRTIVETASDAFVEMDQHGLIVDWNRRAETMFGWSREEAVGRELATAIIPEELRGAHRDGLRRYLQTGVGSVVSKRIEFEALHRDGVRFPVELAVWEVSSPRGRSFNAFLRDITQQKQTEDALATARDRALEASRLKSEFLANMSHEIRTPMNGVIGLTGLLFDTELDATQRKYAQGIRQAGEALLTVINDILDFSKIEAGKVELEQVDFDLRELVEESAGLLAGPAAAKGLELVSYCYPSSPTAVRGDPARLRQVLLNLVGNAVKFTERGEVVVRARLVEDDGEGMVVRFEVVDTGIGIDPTSYARLFESFTQADASTTRRFGGTGLGLTLAKRLVSLMGGEIGVESELGQGSTFWFTARLTKQVGATLTAPPTTSLEGVRVLVVDDNATNRLILEQQLTTWGMRAEAVASPPEALARLRDAADTGVPFGVALVDMQMPEMDGLQLADAIIRDEVLSGLPIILLSSAGALSAADNADGAIRLSLMKPVRQSELYDALSRALVPPLEPSPTANGDSPAAEPVAWRGHVLVVEDNVINQTVATGTLAMLGYRTDVAGNGQEAVEAVFRQDYAAVLMDCQMPVMDGYEATKEIRRRESNGRHIPIIAMTASAMEGDRERCLAAGMDDYVPKPVRREEMEAALQRCVGGDVPRPPVGGDASPSAVGDVLDRALLEELRELGTATDNEQLLTELVAEFLTQSAVRLEALRAAGGAGDFPGVIRVAHIHRGSAAALGARHLASASAALEEAAEAGDPADVAERLDALRAEQERATAALRSEAWPADAAEGRSERADAEPRRPA